MSSQPYAWARGLGRRAVVVTVAVAMVLAVTAGLFVFFLRDTPPANAAVHHSYGSGMDALLEARLVMTHECITVEMDGYTWVPIFPSRSVRLEHDTLRYAGTAYRTGDTIALAGGEVSDPPADARIPQGCPTVSLWMVAP